MSMYYMGSVQELPEASHAEVERFMQLGVPVFEPEAAPVCHAVTLGTMQDDGIRLTVINLLKSPSLNELYMQCNRNSQKVKNLQACSRAEIAITNGMGYVILTCSASVVTDERIKAEKWEDWMTQYHPQGAAEPDYVLLHFVPQSIRAAF